MVKTNPGKRLRDARESVRMPLEDAAALTRHKLGRPMGISRETLRRMEHGLLDPREWNSAALVVLSVAYGVDPESIIPPEVDRAGLAYLDETVSDLVEQGLLQFRCIAA